MSQQPVIADIDAESSKDKKPYDEKSHPCPAKKPGKKRQNRDQVAQREGVDDIFFQFHFTQCPTRRFRYYPQVSGQTSHSSELKIARLASQAMSASGH